MAHNGNETSGLIFSQNRPAEHRAAKKPAPGFFEGGAFLEIFFPYTEKRGAKWGSLKAKKLKGGHWGNGEQKHPEVGGSQKNRPPGPAGSLSKAARPNGRGATTRGVRARTGRGGAVGKGGGFKPVGFPASFGKSTGRGPLSFFF